MEKDHSKYQLNLYSHQKNYIYFKNYRNKRIINKKIKRYI
jgi:hypothetical protein